MGQSNNGKRGQPRKLRNGADIRIIHEIPEPPEYFGEEERSIWAEVAEILISRYDLSEGDLGTLEVYCHNLRMFRECNRRLAADGLTVEKRSGPQPHPLLNARKGAEAQIAMTAAVLGLTPYSRRSLKHDSSNDAPGDVIGGF